jgi:hypothetical protein
MPFLAMLEKVWPLLVAKAGQGDNVTAIVKTARAWFSFSFATILLAWYTSWRNKRVPEKDFTKWPIPGLSKDPELGAPSREDPDVASYDAAIGGSGNAITANDSIGVLPGAVGTQNLGPTPANTGSNSTSLHNLAVIASQQFGLRVGEYPPFGPVHQVHTSGSYHYKGQAFDASGIEVRMHAFAQFVKQNYGRTITELIHNPGFSIKNGQVVPPSFWGTEVWNGHKDHVHVAIAK